MKRESFILSGSEKLLTPTHGSTLYIDLTFLFGHFEKSLLPKLHGSYLAALSSHHHSNPFNPPR